MKLLGHIKYLLGPKIGVIATFSDKSTVELRLMRGYTRRSVRRKMERMKQIAEQEEAELLEMSLIGFAPDD